MKWLPLLLMLCGFSPGQSNDLAAIAQAIWETGVLCPGSGQRAGDIEDDASDRGELPPGQSKAA